MFRPLNELVNEYIKQYHNQTHQMYLNVDEEVDKAIDFDTMLDKAGVKELSLMNDSIL